MVSCCISTPGSSGTRSQRLEGVPAEAQFAHPLSQRGVADLDELFLDEFFMDALYPALAFVVQTPEQVGDRVAACRCGRLRIELALLCDDRSHGIAADGRQRLIWRADMPSVCSLKIALRMSGSIMNFLQLGEK